MTFLPFPIRAHILKLTHATFSETLIYKHIAIKEQFTLFYHTTSEYSKCNTAFALQSSCKHKHTVIKTLHKHSLTILNQLKREIIKSNNTSHFHHYRFKMNDSLNIQHAAPTSTT